MKKYHQLVAGAPTSDELTAPSVTLPAMQYLSVIFGNDNRLKIGEKSSKPIDKEI
jgi:hypothetical protein